MKTLSLLFSATLAASAACGSDPFTNWTPPGPDDVRAPCPMLNSLANHGFLPHSGKDISKEKTAAALSDALNIDKDLGEMLFGFAVTTNPDNTSSTFSLDHLSRHNVLEHDASLSRSDAYLSTAPQHILNQTAWQETKSYWKYPIIDVAMGVTARLGRIRSSRAANPTYSLSQLGDTFSIGEVGAFILILGDRLTGTVNKTFVEYLFEKERLPVELGWKKSPTSFNRTDLTQMIARIKSVESAIACPVIKRALADGTIKLSAGGHGGEF